MASTINITRALRVENEAGIVGAEAETVNGADIFSQVVSAGTEEQTAMGAFKDHQLQALALQCDVAAEAQFIGVRYAILATVAGPPGTITYTGDLTAFIFPGDLVRVEGTVGNDGVYLAVTVVFAVGVTTITLDNGQSMAGAEGVIGTVSRVCSKTLIGYAYACLATVLGTGAITFTGNVTDKFAAGEYLVINGTVANDGYWYIMSVTFAAGVTTIIVSDPNLAVPVAGLPATEGAVGTFTKCQAFIPLAANVPFLWSIRGGLQNPFLGPDSAVDVSPIFGANRGDVAYCMVNVPGTVNGNFGGRVCLDPIL